MPTTTLPDMGQKRARDGHLGERVVGAREVRLVALLEPVPVALLELAIIIMEDAAGAEVGHVDVLRQADICQVKAADDICPDRLNLGTGQG